MKNIFKQVAISLMLFFSMIAVYAEPSWVMTKHSVPLSYSVDFDFLQEDVLVEKVVRSGLFTPRYYYDLYSAEGAFLARGVNRVISTGLLFASQMEFDLYDEINGYIGYIGGKFWTNGRAKFVFRNNFGYEVGFALLRSDSEQAIFSIITASNEILGSLKGSLSGDLSKWDLDVIKPVSIDPRIIKIFTAFVSDFHETFIHRKAEVRYYSK